MPKREILLSAVTTAPATVVMSLPSLRMLPIGERYVDPCVEAKTCSFQLTLTKTAMDSLLDADLKKDSDPMGILELINAHTPGLITKLDFEPVKDDPTMLTIAVSIDSTALLTGKVGNALKWIVENSTTSTKTLEFRIMAKVVDQGLRISTTLHNKDKVTSAIHYIAEMLANIRKPNIATVLADMTTEDGLLIDWNALILRLGPGVGHIKPT